MHLLFFFRAFATTAAVTLDGNTIGVGASSSVLSDGQACIHPAPDLKTANKFAIIASTTVTNTGRSVVNGDIGVFPGSAVTGFSPHGILIGTMHSADTAAQTASIDVATALQQANTNITAARAVGCSTSLGGVVQLGNLNLTAGLYEATSSMEITSGDLYLDGGGDVNAVFIFSMSTTLVTAVGSSVFLVGGTRPERVLWIVGSAATLGVSSSLSGTIIAGTAITMNTGAKLTGR